MAIAAPYTSTAVTTSVVTLYTAPTAYQRDLILTNGGTATVYVGQGTVSSTQGLPLPSGQTLVLMGSTENVYGITAAGTATMYVGQGSVVSVI